MARKLSRRSIAEYFIDQIEAGTSQSTVVKQIAAYLIETRRTKEISLLIKDIEHELMQRGTVTATVTSAFKLGDTSLSSIKSMIRRLTDTKHVNLSTDVDRAVLGGIKLELPGKELDNTIARKLSGLRANYKKA